MAEYCTPSEISKLGKGMKDSAMYMGVAAGLSSIYYTPTTWDVQGKAIAALAAGAATVIGGIIIGSVMADYLKDCKT
jgi:hypothetical protein